MAQLDPPGCFGSWKVPAKVAQRRLFLGFQGLGFPGFSVLGFQGFRVSGC